jgi:CheY-like chemotaxis protein
VKRILLVDNDLNVRRLVRVILESAGYELIEARSSDAGMQLLRAPGIKVDLLVTDMFMPEMSGLQFAESARAISPGLKLLLLSAFGSTEQEASLPVLHKPFTPEALLDASELPRGPRPDSSGRVPPQKRCRGTDLAKS